MNEASWFDIAHCTISLKQPGKEAYHLSTILHNSLHSDHVALQMLAWTSFDKLLGAGVGWGRKTRAGRRFGMPGNYKSSPMGQTALPHVDHAMSKPRLPQAFYCVLSVYSTWCFLLSTAVSLCWNKLRAPGARWQLCRPIQSKFLILCCKKKKKKAPCGILWMCAVCMFNIQFSHSNGKKSS